jgi:hypothetical protein
MPSSQQPNETLDGYIVIQSPNIPVIYAPLHGYRVVHDGQTTIGGSPEKLVERLQKDRGITATYHKCRNPSIAENRELAEITREIIQNG